MPITIKSNECGRIGSNATSFLNNITCWQINLHKSKAASYNLHEVTKHIKSGLVFTQEPWIHGDMVRGKLPGWEIFLGNQKGDRPRACLYATSDLKCHLLPRFSSADLVAVRADSVCREGDCFIFVSAYMSHDTAAPPQLLRELVDYCDRNNIHLVVGADANAHHTVWGSSDVNDRGEELLEYCMRVNLDVCNVGNKPTFRTRARKEVLDLTLVNQLAWGVVNDWYVSDVPSFSDHMLIRFTVKSSTIQSVEMVRNIRRACWTKYVDELDHRLSGFSCTSELTSTEDVEDFSEKVQSAITHSYEAACPLRKLRRRNENTWWNAELARLRKEARRANRRANLLDTEEEWEAKRLAQNLFKNSSLFCEEIKSFRRATLTLLFG